MSPHVHPRTLRILLVEDNAHHAALLSKHLHSYDADAEVNIVGTPESGLAHVAERPYDVILFDHRLPRMDGLKFLQEIQAHRSPVPVIMMLPPGSEAVAAEASRQGAYETILKPTGADPLPFAHDVLGAIQRFQTEREPWPALSSTEAPDLEHLKTNFLSVISHELRNPLASMKESLSLLLEGVLGRLNEKQRYFLEIVRQDATRLQRLIDDLVDASRLSGGRLSLQRAEVEVDSLLERALKPLESLAAKKQQRLSLACGDGLPMLWVDPDRIIQVVTNLVSNGIKFTPDGGAVRVVAGALADGVELIVEDTGCGIAPEDQPQLFTMFYQGVHSPQAHRTGLGLGLAISRQLIELHGGRLTYASILGRGSRFRCVVPVVPVEHRWQVSIDERLRSARGRGVVVLCVVRLANGREWRNQFGASRIADILADLQRFLQSHVRPMDLVVRLPEGADIAVVMELDQLASLARVQARLRQQLEQLQVNTHGALRPPQFMTGWATMPSDGESAGALLAQARRQVEEPDHGASARAAG